MMERRKKVDGGYIQLNQQRPIRKDLEKRTVTRDEVICFLLQNVAIAKDREEGNLLLSLSKPKPIAGEEHLDRLT
jgi:hypothetical protein